MTDSRMRLLIGVALALGALRFGVVPWLDAQREQHEQLELLTRRLDRSEGVVRSRDAILAARQALEKQAAQMRRQFPAAANVDEFRLAAQQEVGRLAQASSVDVRLFDWVLEGTVPEAGLAYGRARVTLQGALRDVVRVHSELEGALGHAAVRDVTVSMRRSVDETGDGSAEATLLVDLYYRQART